MASICTSSAPRTSLLLLLALLAASSVPASGKVDIGGVLRELFNEGLQWTASKEGGDKLRELWNHFSKHDKDPIIRSFEKSERGGAVSFVTTGSHNFPVGGVDVTSAVTWTSQCAATASRPVPCGDPLCKKYRPGGSRQCGGGDAGKVCGGGRGLLRQGRFSLSTYAGNKAFSDDNDDTVYACSSAAARTKKDTAVVGLSRDSILASSSKRFAYYLMPPSKIWGFLWLGDDVPAATGRSTSTTNLIPTDARYYYVNVTGIKVGDGSVKMDASAGIITANIPFTLLNPVLFSHLEKNLPSGEEMEYPVGRQLCYKKGTKLPAIALVFAGAREDDPAAMKIEPKQYSYTKDDGAVCLSILRSTLPGNILSKMTIIGTMVQEGRRMSFNLRENTLTFES